MRGGIPGAAAALSLLLALFAACGGGNGAPAGGRSATVRPRAALPPGVRPWVGRVAIDWRRGGRPGERILIGPGGLELGPAEGPLARYLFVDRERGLDLRFFVRGFAPFTFTRFGESFAFAGAGPAAASPAERRMIFEWAHLVVDEAVGGRGGGTSAIALTWHRSRDVFGGCDQVVVDLTGVVRAGPCGAEGAGGAPWRGRLAEEQLRRLYAWFDAWAPFQTAGGEADQPGATPVRLIFAGRGQAVATPGEQAAVADFAANLYRELAARHPAPPLPARPAPGPPAAKGVPPKPALAPPPPPPPEPAAPRLLRPASPLRSVPVVPPATPPPPPAPPAPKPKPSVEAPPPGG